MIRESPHVSFLSGLFVFYGNSLLNIGSKFTFSTITKRVCSLLSCAKSLELAPPLKDYLVCLFVCIFHQPAARLIKTKSQTPLKKKVELAL